MPDKARYRRQTLLARLTALFYAHVHGQTPTFADDFRRADRTEYQTPIGDHRVTVEGSTLPQADPIGQSDLPALYFSESSGHLNLGASLGDVSSSKDISFINFSEVATNSNFKRVLSKDAVNRSGVSGGRVDITTGGGTNEIEIFLEDKNGDSTRTFTTFRATDSPFTGVTSFDRSGAVDEMRAIFNGTVTATEDLDAGNIDDLSSTADLLIGYTGLNSDDHRWVGPFNAAAVHPEWTSEPQAAFLDALLRTGNVAPGTAERLASFFTGEPGAGLNRRLPDYLTDAFGAGGPDFWWSADRHIHGVDGEGVVQLPNFAGDWSSDGAVQRTDSAQSVARGSTERGKPLDRIETSAKGYPHVDETQQFSLGSTVVFSLFERESGETQNGILSWRGPGDVTLELRESSGTVDFNVRDSNGNQIVESVSLTTDSGFVAAAGRFDESTGEVEIFAESKSQSQLKSSSSQTFGGNFDGAELRYFALSQGVSGWAFQGDIKQIGYDLSGATSSEVSALVSSLVTNL